MVHDKHWREREWKGQVGTTTRLELKMLYIYVHVINGLITRQKRDQLIATHALNVVNPVLTNMVNYPKRDRAQQLILQDTIKYRDSVKVSLPIP